MRLGPYELSAEIGRGGMGVVYRGRSPGGADVAVKLLLGKSVTGAARFERERRLLDQLGDDAGFVPLLDAGESERGPYIVMPFLPNGTLADRLRHGPLGLSEALELVREIAATVSRAHAFGIVHRDLKPSNVIFDARNRPLVADLGLAKHYRFDAPGASQSVELTEKGGVRGTVGYMAPEQAGNPEGAGPAADVFSLGAILYECLAGRPPFAGVTVIEAIAAAASGSYDPVRQHRPEVPRWLARAIDRALRPEPRRRPKDAGAFGRTLRRPRSFAVLVLAGGALALGVSLLARELRERGERPRRLREQARALLAAKQLRDADTLATSVLTLVPDDLEALVLRGEARIYIDARGAIADLERAVALEPRHAQAWEHLGAARLVAGEGEKAREALARAVELAPEAAGPWRKRAMARLRRDDLEGTEADATRSLAIAPNNVDSLMVRTEARSRRGTPEALALALEDARQAVALAPRSALAWGMLGSVFTAMQKAEDAIVAHTIALSLDPALFDVWGERGGARGALGDLDGKIADTTQSLEIKPSGHAYAVRGQAYAERGQLEFAHADLARAVVLDPKLYHAWLLKGDAAALLARNATGEERERYDAEALECLGRAIELQPRNALAWGFRARAHDIADRHDAAIADATQALELDSRLPVAFKARANSYSARGRYLEAATDFKSALALEPENLEILLALGGVLLLANENEEVRLDMDRAIALAPGSATAWAQRGEAHRRLGDRRRAEADFEKALSLDPNERLARQGLDRIRSAR